MMRKLLLLFVFALVSIGTWAKAVNQGADGNWYIGPDGEGNYFKIENGVAEFHMTATQGPGANPGNIAGSWNEISQKLGGVTRIKFANDCLINKADLICFLQGNNYYVDLFDITNGENAKMSTTDIDPIIEASVADMVTNSWQAKGIILPLNTSLGTSKMEKANSSGGETFTEYAVYYRDTQKTATIYAHDGNMRYSFEWVSSNTDAQNHYNTAYEHLSSHSLVANAKTFIVSTNNKMRGSDQGIDVSSTITGSDVTKISIINDEMVYLTQTGRNYLATITVDGAAAGAFAAAVANTNIKYTPCEKLIVKGSVSDNDVKAVNDFSDSSVEGPLVYDLKGATDFSTAMLPGITNSKLEYIILPDNLSNTKIPASYFSSSLTNLKAAIASTSTLLSAYVKEPGSLLMARYYATGGAVVNGATTPTTVGLQYVTLTGTLNARDICANSDGKVGEDGHWTTGESVSRGLNGETGVTAIDLEDAVFPEQYDMNFYKAGFENLTSLLLPTSPSMNILPENCLYNIKKLKYLCVPYNYEYFRDGCLNANGGGVDHLTTTDASGAEIDNGEKTWTISANVKELGTRPGENYNGEFVATVFPMNVGVQDIYCLAVKVPKCYANVFPDNACYGWGGDDSTKPYCRDRYFNGGNPDEAWAVLHFPSKESWEKSAGTKEADYETLKRLYTDVNKEFTKKEQTGAVDANGDAIAWPTHWEGYRSYNQASLGLTWNDWDVQHNATIEGHINDGGGINQGTAVGNRYQALVNENAGSGEGDYDFTEYMGWHQIVLALATYVEPDEIIEEEKIVREYEEAGWYTFCIPFDMTVSQVQEMLGVPASSGNVICKLNGEEVTTPIMPDIRQLTSVTRSKGVGSARNVVTLRLTNNLWNGSKAQYLDFNVSSEANGQALVDAATQDNSNRCLVGGRPYIIKAYKRKGETIKRQNIGMLVMTRYADQFGVEASCVMNGLYEQLGSGDLITLRFAIPYENHKVQALRADESTPYLEEYTVDGTTQTYRYNYTLVGQFWQQPLPQYCFYMSKGKWYRYTDTSKGYTWDPYKCIIMATQEIDDGHSNGGGYRDNEHSNYPNIVSGTTDLLDGEFRIGFLDGRDDDDFQNMQASEYVFSFDDGITVYNEDGYEVTAIESIDGESMTATPVNGKVYNMSGQLVGTSLERLGKGMYIVNGKKYVVK